jgi:3D-(3,5/4)-trihydroxycyclohexane-1,2-dione acylhydrolase (decyclizing)
MVGDGSYLMMAQELVTAVQERVKLTIVLVQNHGFASIGALSESLGSQRFGTRYRYRNPRRARWTATAAGRPGGERREPRRATSRRDDDRRASRRRCATAAASERTPSCSVETDPLVPRRARRPGGTSRSPRSPAREHRAAPRDVRARQATQRRT